MKIWCEKCNGYGNHGYVIEFEGDEGYAIKCTDCDGNGYTENTEIERLAEIGKATEKWFKEDHIMEYGYNELYHTDDLLDWAKGDELCT